MPVEVICFHGTVIRIEGAREEIDRGLERLRAGDEVFDIEERFEDEGCHVRLFPP